MNNLVLILSAIGTIFSIYFSCIKNRRINNQGARSTGKLEGTIEVDITYIKECLNRVENNLTKLDEKYLACIERVVKVEVAVSNVIKRVDELFKIEGG